MRDIAVTLLFMVIIYYSLRKPFIGVSAWAWITFAYPAGWAWGFSNNFRMNLTVVILTFVSYLFVKNKAKLQLDGITVLILFLWVIALFSSLSSESLLNEIVWAKFEEFSKVLLFYFAITVVAYKKIHIDTLIWAIILSISSYAGMEGIKFIASLGGHRISGIEGYLLADRNDLAVAINMSLPLIIYLIGEVKHQWLRIGLIALLVLNIVAVIGTFSRAGFVGLFVISLYFFIRSNRKLLWSAIVATSLAVAVPFIPTEWTQRMDTVATVQQDNSFIGRLWAWKISVKIANDNVFGNGFFASQDPIAWRIYKGAIDEFGGIKTPSVPDSVKPKAAHSIYFQVLGDLGYLGLALYLMILLGVFMRLNRVAKRAKQKGIEWCGNLSMLLTVSLVGYGVTGASVSLAYFDLIFAFIGISYVLKHRVLNG
ncbi:putative O-glycosylation ligase, exosortase A system-associated [Thalassotalea sp. ND16A]|uniref:putative O-glycosylation ligase, exosortase A system-associated n=1 Tax=Thalassotalea sp. ND16A TaxID=1535422 RepID=UPI00051D5961|nr:putative O-glycosylation ligase, exosortase A system-associated [Thalassotalea sp. ND16A]KGJ95953.1 hypothetical protein ND16A_1132 [Thalassotalea sp. ND16A]